MRIGWEQFFLPRMARNKKIRINVIMALARGAIEHVKTDLTWPMRSIAKSMHVDPRFGMCAIVDA